MATETTSPTAELDSEIERMKIQFERDMAEMAQLKKRQEQEFAETAYARRLAEEAAARQAAIDTKFEKFETEVMKPAIEKMAVAIAEYAEINQAIASWVEAGKALAARQMALPGLYIITNFALDNFKAHDWRECFESDTQAVQWFKECLMSEKSFAELRTEPPHAISAIQWKNEFATSRINADAHALQHWLDAMRNQRRPLTPKP